MCCSPTLCVIVVALLSSFPFRIYIYRNVTHSQNVLYPLESPVTTFHLWGDGGWGAGSVVDAATELITVFMVNNSTVTQVCLFRKYKWRPALNEAWVILFPILRTWKWQYVTMPYRNPLNTEKRKTGNEISCSLNRVGIVLNKLYEIAVS